MDVHETKLTHADRQGRRVRLGLLSPASDILIERDFWRLGLAANVDIYTTRIALEMPLTPVTLARLADGIGGATELLLPETEIDALVFGCTSGSAVIGPDNVAARVHAVKPGLAVTNPATAAVAALDHLGCKRIAFIAPYTPDVAEITAGVFRNGGITISSARCLGLLTDEEIALPGPDHYLKVLEAMDLTDAEAIFISCTTSRGLDAIAPVEAATGLPVVTSNQASFWHALQLIDRPARIEGFGRLLQ